MKGIEKIEGADITINNDRKIPQNQPYVKTVIAEEKSSDFVKTRTNLMSDLFSFEFVAVSFSIGTCPK